MGQKKSPSRRTPALTFALVVASVALAFAIAETTIRLFPPDEGAIQLSLAINPYLMDPVPVGITHLSGPEEAGYYLNGPYYFYRFDRPIRSVSDRFEPSFPVRPYVPGEVHWAILGGSAAAGFGASEPRHAWFSVLEQRLASALKKPVVLENLAFSGANSTQERLAQILVAFPRHVQGLVILDGFNDLASPGVRPGDPINQGVEYRLQTSLLFSLETWLAGYSMFYKTWLKYRAQNAWERNDKRMWEPGKLRENNIRSTVSVYLDNLKAMAEECDLRKIPCLFFLQPARDFKASATSAVATLYSAVLSEITAPAWQGPKIVDLTSLASEPEFASTFMNAVHFKDRGQLLLAERMLPTILREMKRHPTRVALAASAR